MEILNMITCDKICNDSNFVLDGVFFDFNACEYICVELNYYETMVYVDLYSDFKNHV